MSARIRGEGGYTIGRSPSTRVSSVDIDTLFSLEEERWGSMMIIDIGTIKRRTY